MKGILELLAKISGYYATFGANVASLHGSYEAEVPHDLKKNSAK